MGATVSLLDNADNSILDDVWAWRADHGKPVGWTENIARTGVAVTGDDVTAYGLAVEHYQKCEVVWRGQGGHDVVAVWIGGSGGDDSIVNGVGGPVTSTNPGTPVPVDVASYPGVDPYPMMT